MARVWGTRGDADLEWRLRDGVINILSVGPFEESSNLERIVAVFAFYLSYGHNARLVLVGSITDRLALTDRFYTMVARSGLSGRIVLIDPYSRERAAAAYATAKLFISFDDNLSSSDAFLDAMAFGVPILATASQRTRTMLGSAGMLVSEDSEDIEIGTVAYYLVEDEALRKAVLAEQRRRLRSASVSA